MSRSIEAASSDYAATWLRSLGAGNIREDWHLDVIQAQFLDGEARHARQDFIDRHVGRTTSGVSLSDRERIVAAAARLLREHGRVPKISLLWFPTAWREQMVAAFAA